MGDNNGGVDHVVLLKVKEGTTEDEIQRLFEGIRSLNVIPGVVSVTVGPTFCESWMSDRRGGYTHALRIRLASKEALHVYQNHELHAKVIRECIKPILEIPPMALDWTGPELKGTKD
mmetsp:Transcript_15709/g.28573  ORF Transcript_15709/g.28573 Transcript_15709/m.28573 type:complete len:117 (-) Transcript_15709:1421-1771(-)